MKNIPFKTYFDNLDYEYIETYSFKRGPKLDMELRKKDFVLNGTSFVTNPLGQFDPTAEKIAIVKKITGENEEIKRIVDMQLIDIPLWMCTPFYRDALVFRTKNDQIADTLNICFECSYMKSNQGNFIDADQKMYDGLQLLLRSLGHNIQKNETIQLLEKIKEGKVSGNCFI